MHITQNGETFYRDASGLDFSLFDDCQFHQSKDKSNVQVNLAFSLSVPIQVAVHNRGTEAVETVHLSRMQALNLAHELRRYAIGI